MLNIITLIPEFLVLLSAITLLIGGVFAGDKKSDRYLLWLGVFVLLTLAGIMVLYPAVIAKQILFSHQFIADKFSQAIKLLLVIGTGLILIISDGWLIKDDNQKFEYPVLILFSLLGMMLMVSANDFLSLYIALELASLPSYVLASFKRDSIKSTESGVKYFVLGAIASGIILFGITLIYGFAGSTNFESLGFLLKSVYLSKGVLVGLVLVITGFCFKVSAAPFHMWTPDVYEGAPTPITAYFSVVPKIAALALFIRILTQPFAAVIHDWQQIIIVVSALSMLVGAFGALFQTNIKRLLAYSSIGHVGYALMGLATGSIDGVAGIIIYFTLYIAMSVGAFSCILGMQRGGEYSEEISDLSGLSKNNPKMAFALAVFMFSMAGIPPLAGFFGKMYVFLAAIHSGLFGLAVVGVLSSVVACYYYIKIVKLMYFDEPVGSFDNCTHFPTILVRWICMIITLVFFVYPTPIINFASEAAGALFQ